LHALSAAFSPPLPDRVRQDPREVDQMSTKAQALAESEARLEAKRQLLGNVASINQAVQGLTNVVEYENQHFAERIQRVEVQLSQLYSVVRKIVEHLDAQQDPGDWWKTGRNGDGGGP
jgi:hypothetical protein